MTAATFLGDAPSMDAPIGDGFAPFGDNAPRFGIYYVSGSFGFNWPPWNGYPASILEITVADVSVFENAGTADIVVIAPGSTTGFQVDYFTHSGTAAAGSDFTQVSGTAVVPAGQSQVSISIPISDDNFVEVDESFVLTLSNSVGIGITDGESVISIVDNDVTAITIEDASVEETAGTAHMNVRLSSPSVHTVTFAYELTDATATTGEDYTGTSGYVTIPVGETTAVISVSILDDALVEGTESFTVIIENVVGADPLKSAGVVTIIDGGPGYDGWAVEQGLTENAGISDDASGDGFANSFHYAMRVPATAFIPSDYPDLVPRMDTELFGNKAAFVFKIPVDARDDIALDVDESFDMQNWSVIASKEGSGKWVFEFPNVVIQDEPEDGYRGVAVTATNTFAQRDPGFYRLNVRMR